MEGPKMAKGRKRDVANTGNPPVIIVFFNPLNPQDRESHIVTAGAILFREIQRIAPYGFGRPISLLRNGEPLPVEESDIALKHDDVISVMVQPAGLPSFIIAAIVQAVITIAASIIVRLIFGKPKNPSSQTPNPDPVYSLQGGANAARLGEPVPVIYGEVITYPDYVAPPYVWFEGNNQYIGQVLCLGHGEFQIHDILIGDTPTNVLAPNGSITWREWKPGQHRQTMGVIESATGIFETMITSIEVSDIELSGNPVQEGGWNTVTLDADFVAPDQIHLHPNNPAFNFGPNQWISVYNSQHNNGSFLISAVNGSHITIDTNYGTVVDEQNVTFLAYVHTAPIGSEAGPFATAKPGNDGDMIQCDFVFPQGLYTLDQKTGALRNQQVDFSIICQPVDNVGNNAGAAITRTVSVVRATNTPVRITEQITVPPARYTVKVVRSTPPPPNTNVVNTFTWTGLKFKLLKTTTPVYGETTLLSVKIRATSGISSDAGNKIRVRCTRRLPRLGQGVLVPTRDPADAFTDIIHNSVYGAARPLIEIDTSELNRLSTHWAKAGNFNGIINQRSTVWEALQLVLQTVACVPVQSGAKTSLIQDGKKLFPVQMFSSANIIENSFTATYGFDKPGDYSGYQIEYRNPIDFTVAYEQYPPTAVEMETVSLFGCTDKTTAQQYARLLWQRRLYQRKNIEFETEMEGMLPRIGDRIAVSNEIVNWGESGEVALFKAATNTVLLDRTPNWAAYTTPVLTLRGSDGKPSAPLPVTRGASPREAILSGVSAPFVIADALARSSATLWAMGDSSAPIKDFTITEIEHTGNGITRIQATNYDERVYEQTLPFQARPS
jgi:hypothetical protein